MRSKLPLLALIALLLIAAGCSSCGSSCDSGGIPCEYNTTTCTVPSVIGVAHDTAVAKLRAAGFLSHSCIGNPSHVAIAIVTDQSPPAGTRMTCDNVVDLIFYPHEYKEELPAPPPPPPSPRGR